MTDENPVLKALEVYKRTHPRRAHEVDAAFEEYEDSESAIEDPAAHGEHDPEADSEQLPLDGDQAA